MINFISANNGKIELFAHSEFIAAAETAKSICYFLQEYGFDGHYYTSSTIDFASEYGFDNDEDAHALFEEGVKLFYMTEIQ